MTIKMIKVGITGEMGSGKSYCAKLFEQLGVPVFYSDDVARYVINNKQPLKDQIVKEFGEVYDENGKMIPDVIRGIIFVKGGESKLQRLNELAHPYVFDEFINFCDTNKDEKYIIAESAILYETELKDRLDEVIYVFANEDIRMKRAFERSGFDENDYRSRMKSQISSNDKMIMSEYTIFNNDGDDVQRQVNEINNTIKYN